MDLASGDQLQSQEDLAKELDSLKICKQISVKAKKFQPAIDSLMQVCLDPSKGLSEESLDVARSQNEESLIEKWIGITPENFVLVSTIIIGGLSFLGYTYHKKLIRT